MLYLTHWGRVTHICIGKLITIGSDNGLSPGQRQAIIWTITGILLIGPLGTNRSEIWIGIQTFSFKKMHLKMSQCVNHSYNAIYRWLSARQLCISNGITAVLLSSLNYHQILHNMTKNMTPVGEKAGRWWCDIYKKIIWSQYLQNKINTKLRDIWWSILQQSIKWNYDHFHSVSNISFYIKLETKISASVSKR